MNALTLPASPGVAFNGLNLSLDTLDDKLWLTNDQLERCLDVAKGYMRKLVNKLPGAFSEDQTRIIKADLLFPIGNGKYPDLPSHVVTANAPKRGRGQGKKDIRIWSFPLGCHEAAMHVPKPQARQFSSWLMRHLYLKAEQHKAYIGAKRPNMRKVAQAADAGGNTRAQMQAAGFKCMESARRNRKEAFKAGLLNTPALPVALQLVLFAVEG